MFELFMMCLFAVIGMLLGNLVFNIIIALSNRIETYFDTNVSDDNLLGNKAIIYRNEVEKNSFEK